MLKNYKNIERIENTILDVHRVVEDKILELMGNENEGNFDF